MGITRSINNTTKNILAYWRRKFNKLLKVAKENGIIPSTFYGRVNSGWDPQDAATIPVRKLNERKGLAKVAEENGISASTFRSRVATYGWDPEKAATTPARRKKQRKHQLKGVDENENNGKRCIWSNKINQ